YSPPAPDRIHRRIRPGPRPHQSGAGTCPRGRERHMGIKPGLGLAGVILVAGATSGCANCACWGGRSAAPPQTVAIPPRTSGTGTQPAGAGAPAAGRPANSPSDPTSPVSGGVTPARGEAMPTGRTGATPPASPASPGRADLPPAPQP